MIDKTLTEQVKIILFRFIDPDEYTCFIFGSRAEGTNEKYSDIDIGIEGKKPLSAKTHIELEEAFEESDLPYRVDVVDFSTVSDKFKTVAKQHTITI